MNTVPLTAKERRVLSDKLAAAVLWHEHWLHEDGPDSICAVTELEYARDLASQLLGHRRSQFVPANLPPEPSLYPTTAAGLS